ncbi:hypothetical protein [Azospirillum endophyticum]
MAIIMPHQADNERIAPTDADFADFPLYLCGAALLLLHRFPSDTDLWALSREQILAVMKQHGGTPSGPRLAPPRFRAGLALRTAALTASTGMGREDGLRTGGNRPSIHVPTIATFLRR